MNDKPVFQLYGFWLSIAILEYLEERFPEPALLPEDLHARARVRSLAAVITSDTHPLIVPRVASYLMTQAQFDQAAWRAWSSHWVTRGVAAIEARLASDATTGTFCHGEQVTMADICLASVMVVAKILRVEFSQIPTVLRIVEQCEHLEAFQRASPMRQLGAPAPG